MVSARIRLFFSVLLLALACDAGAMSMPRFDKLERDLKIRPEQKQQFDTAVGATQRALLAVGMTLVQFKDRLAQELLKPRPDMRAFFEAQEAIIEQAKPLFREAREEWVRLYAQLDDEQIEIARAFVEQQLGRLILQMP